MKRMVSGSKWRWDQNGWFHPPKRRKGRICFLLWNYLDSRHWDAHFGEWRTTVVYEWARWCRQAKRYTGPTSIPALATLVTGFYFSSMLHRVNIDPGSGNSADMMLLCNMLHRVNMIPALATLLTANFEQWWTGYACYLRAIPMGRNCNVSAGLDLGLSTVLG